MPGGGVIGLIGVRCCICSVKVMVVVDGLGHLLREREERGTDHFSLPGALLCPAPREGSGP